MFWLARKKYVRKGMKLRIHSMSDARTVLSVSIIFSMCGKIYFEKNRKRNGTNKKNTKSNIWKQDCWQFSNSIVLQLIVLLCVFFHSFHFRRKSSIFLCVPMQLSVFLSIFPFCFKQSVLVLFFLIFRLLLFSLSMCNYRWCLVQN